MYTIYQSSPRRSPRHIQTSSESNLKPKPNSPIRKSKVPTKMVPTSAPALAAVTGTRKPRKKRVNDGNKENCGQVTRPMTRTAGLQVNASNGMVGKGSQSLQSKVDAARLPLKELPLNVFTERSRKRNIVPSVEIVVRLFPWRSH